MAKNQKDLEDPIDRHVGYRLRERRGLLSYSLDRLARAVGITPEQLQCYENGEEHLPIETLNELCHILDVAPNYFFSGDCMQFRPEELEDEGKTMPHNFPFTRGETLELIKVWYEISDEGIRNSCLDFPRSMALGQRLRNGN